MDILDFLTRLILIPCAYIVILAYIPEAIKDIKKEFLPQVSKKRKPVRQNSLMISNLEDEENIRLLFDKVGGGL